MSDNRVPAEYMKMDIADAQRFDQKVKENFMPAFPSVARQIIEDYGILEGICIDVGCGSALMAIELCKRSNLRIYGSEIVKSICQVAYKNIESEGLRDRIIPILSNAYNLPFKSESADFVISRGSYHCWRDKPRVLREIYRVLKGGGIGLVGGGFGRYVTNNELDRMIALRDKSLKDDAKAYRAPDKLKEVIREAGISNFRIIYDKTGLWAEIKK